MLQKIDKKSRKCYTSYKYWKQFSMSNKPSSFKTYGAIWKYYENQSNQETWNNRNKMTFNNGFREKSCQG